MRTILNRDKSDDPEYSSMQYSMKTGNSSFPTNVSATSSGLHADQSEMKVRWRREKEAILLYPEAFTAAKACSIPAPTSCGM
jgi:hypothetical protein